MKQGFKACVCAVVLCAELFAAGALSAYAAQEQPLPDSGMTLDTAELTLDITEGDPAPVAYLNVQAPNDYFFLIWTSSDPAVASVDGTGKVTGHAEGTAAVTARNERGEKTTCTITVRKSTASRLVLNTSDLTLTITEQEPAPTKQLKLEQNDRGFIYVRQWVSSSPSVAQVSSSGTVTGQSSGRAVISALTTAGQVLRCTVTITSEIGRVQMSKNAMLLQAVGASQKLTAQAAGTVTSIHVQEGQTVAENDILIELSGDDLTESIQSASETLRSAEISLQNLQDTMANYTVTSPISGTIIEKDAKVGDAVKSGDTLCVIYDLSYLEMVINVDELQISSLSVGQKVQITADAVQDKNYVGTVTRVSMKGASNGGTTTYPVTIRIDETDGLRPGMNANAEIVVAEAANALTVPNAAIVRGGYVLVTQDSPSASKADTTMEAPEGFVYVAVKTGVSDDDYTQIVSGIQEGDTIGYDPNSVSSDSYYYDDGSSMMIF